MLVLTIESETRLILACFQSQKSTHTNEWACDVNFTNLSVQTQESSNTDNLFEFSHYGKFELLLNVLKL